ncbi:hypothetical protein ROLI_016760 [Roseobacter fucihabitans]|uniref:Uncharacterized protein n=1 Tax=Roseobacter fucihabitans TaxID=1537242 RepID=A0ABZ2BTR7_9RHOB|nr:hypothetical protein [Roseobacter litoralis]MBC6964449.1 hypothetical protein [Roseobacter litoralis]
MREILLAGLAMIVISVAASFGLKEIGFSSADQNTGQAVRLD